MMTISKLIVAIGVAFASGAAAQDAPEGKAQFTTSCGVCHAVELGAPPRQGPNLAGIYGRAAGIVADFKYSTVLKTGGWVWDEATLDPWMENAQAVHPGTIMNYRQRDPEKRKAILTYLKTLTEAK